MCSQPPLGALSAGSGCSVSLKDASAGRMIADNAVWTQILKMMELLARWANLADVDVLYR